MGCLVETQRMAVRMGRNMRQKTDETAACAARIKRLREEAEMTQDQLGKAIGTSRDMVYKWEKDQNTPSTPFLQALAGVFRVDPQWLLTGKTRDSGPANEDDTDPALDEWLAMVVEFGDPPTEGEIEALRSMRPPPGKRFRPEWYGYVFPALRTLTTETQGQSRSSKAVASPIRQKARPTPSDS